MVARSGTTLLCGGTGLLGGRIAERLAERDAPLRALVRDGSDASELERLGAEVVRGDLRDYDSLEAAVRGVGVVVSTANAIGRAGLEIREVDLLGNRSLVDAAERGGARRFVFVSIAGFDGEPGCRTPFVAAKRATEERLRSSSLEAVIVRPDAFQEIWLSPAVGFDWPDRKVAIFGKGQSRARYVAVDDVAALVAELAHADEPPTVVEVGGPETHTRLELIRLFEEALQEAIRVRHVPRTVLRVGSRALRRVKPRTASLMGMGLHLDLNDATWDDGPLRAVGIAPRATSAYVRQLVEAATTSGG